MGKKSQSRNGRFSTKNGYHQKDSVQSAKAPKSGGYAWNILVVSGIVGLAALSVHQDVGPLGTGGTLRPLVRMALRLFQQNPHPMQPETTEKPVEKTKKNQESVKVGLCDASGPYATAFEMKTYRALCADNTPRLAQLNVTSQDLRCRYLTGRGHPYLVIQPVKAEHVTRYPEMWLYYDLLADSQIEELKSIARTKIAPSKISANTDGRSYGFRDKTRNSQTAWLRNEDYEINRRLMYLVEAFTNLNMNTAESMQVAYYENVGYYDPHFDWFQERDLNVGLDLSGNRHATFLFYLNDVPRGGYTAFPCSGVSVKPQKGQAVLWYNLDDMGMPLHESMHGACEAYGGEKWVANWWVREGWRGISQRCTAGRPRPQLARDPARLRRIMGDVPSYRNPRFISQAKMEAQIVVEKAAQVAREKAAATQRATPVAKESTAAVKEKSPDASRNAPESRKDAPATTKEPSGQKKSEKNKSGMRKTADVPAEGKRKDMDNETTRRSLKSGNKKKTNTKSASSKTGQKLVKKAAAKSKPGKVKDTKTSRQKDSTKEKTI